MLPLVLPEPAGGPPAIPAAVATPVAGRTLSGPANEHAGVAADHGAFAAMVEAGNDDAEVGPPRAAIAIAQMRTRGDNWLLSKLAALVPALPPDAAAPSVAPSTEEEISASSDEDDADDESVDFPFDTSANDIDVLVGEWPAIPTSAFRIPIPGDEDADPEEASAPTVDTGQERPGSAQLKLNDLMAASPSDRADVAIEFAATDHSGQAGGAVQTENGVGSRLTGTPLAQAATVASTPDAPDAEPIAATEAPVVGEAADVPVAEQPASAPGRQHQPASAARPDHRVGRAIAHANAPGQMTRSAVATAATSSDTPADAVRAVIDAGLAFAVPAQDATGSSRETSGVRAPSSDTPSRQNDALMSSLPFSTDRDSSESGAREEDARGRQASAMFARLAAAVASTSESSSSRTASATPVFTIPTIQPAPSQAVMPSIEISGGATATVPAENVERLVQTMHVNLKAGVMEATVRLRPEYLGEVTIQLRVDGSTVSAVIQTESAGVRQWLESQEQTIRNGLAAHGLDLGRLVVNPDGERQQAHDETEANELRRRAYRRRQQSTERFEITV